MRILTQGIVSVGVAGIALASWYLLATNGPPSGQTGATAATGPASAGPGARGRPGGLGGRGPRATSVVAAPVEIGALAGSQDHVEPPGDRIPGLLQRGSEGRLVVTGGDQQPGGSGSDQYGDSVLA